MKQKQKQNTLTTNNTTKSAKNRIKNWHFYNSGLVDRGAFLNLAETAIKEAERESRQRAKRVGRPREHQDAIILVIAVYREMFQLTLRQAEGFAKDIFRTFGIKLPHYSTLDRRLKTLNIDLRIDRRRLRGGAVLLVDSTGFKISGEGEWKVRKHGTNKRRGWAKTHYVVDFNSLQVLSMSVTPERVGDNVEVPHLLDLIPENVHVDELIGDGFYNNRALYHLAYKKNIKLIAPPRLGGKRSKHTYVGGYDEYVLRCEEIGRENWKNEIGYHRRSLVETNMFRFKQVFSASVKGRTLEAQTKELQVRAMVLNMWTNLWMPKYTKPAAQHKI